MKTSSAVPLCPPHPQVEAFANFLAELQVWGTPDQVFDLPSSSALHKAAP
jgi:hypothetical protein